MVSKAAKVDLEAAIAFIEHSKNTHTKWVRYIREGRATAGQRKVAGDRKHHERCISEYQHVLATLRS